MKLTIRRFPRKNSAVTGSVQAGYAAITTSKLVIITVGMIRITSDAIRPKNRPGRRSRISRLSAPKISTASTVMLMMYAA